MSFFSRLADRARATDSLLCVGLDPHPELVGSDDPSKVRAWALQLIEATAPVACAFKPNAAFFEALGPAGWEVLREVIQAAGKHAPVILDAKRGDIASTASAYARSVFDKLGADAVTLSPYLGHDSLQPFLEDPDCGVFLLCKTSNPGSKDLQAAPLAGGGPLYRRVARLAAAWNTHDNLGLVVGATDPSALAAVRQDAPTLWFLTPGVGEQGGRLEQALPAGVRSDGLGMLIPLSRGIARAPDPAAEARRLRDEINRLRSLPRPSGAGSGERARLADSLVDIGCVRFGEFALKSGLLSPIYIDLRRLASFPDVLATAVAAYQEVLAELMFDRLAAIPYAAMAIGAAIALASGRPMIYPRMEVKDHGTRRAVEGEYQPGETAVVIDDLATTGGSKFEAIERLRQVGLLVNDVVVLIDRQSGAGPALEARGIRFHAVFTLNELLDHWERSGRVAPDQVAATRRFLQSQAGYVDVAPREEE